MKRMLFILLTITVLTTSTLAHPGRTDQYGGHFNRSTGEYHYHSYYGVDKPGYPYPGGAGDTPTITSDQPKSYEPEKSYTPPSAEPEPSAPRFVPTPEPTPFQKFLSTMFDLIPVFIIAGICWLVNYKKH